MKLIMLTDFYICTRHNKKETPNHPYYVKSVGTRGETSFSYHFNLPQDNQKTVFLEIIAFHYDK